MKHTSSHHRSLMFWIKAYKSANVSARLLAKKNHVKNWDNLRHNISCWAALIFWMGYLIFRGKCVLVPIFYGYHRTIKTMDGSWMLNVRFHTAFRKGWIILCLEFNPWNCNHNRYSKKNFKLTVSGDRSSLRFGTILLLERKRRINVGVWAGNRCWFKKPWKLALKNCDNTT